jgi:hypothetical protein
MTKGLVRMSKMFFEVMEFYVVIDIITYVATKFIFLLEIHSYFGGFLSTGVEIWNPYAGSVKLILDVHPQETPANGLSSARLVPIKGKKMRIAFLFESSFSFNNYLHTQKFCYGLNSVK